MKSISMWSNIMKSLPIGNNTEFPHRMASSNPCIAPLPYASFIGSQPAKQRGVVLFFTLIALLAMSLAAVALIRSVDTSAMIVGNLAYKEMATTSADAGIETSLASLEQIKNINLGVHPDLDTDPLHPFNQTNLAVIAGYYSSLDPAMVMTDPANWTGNKSVAIPGTDPGGSQLNYIVQRMCRYANTIKRDADCLLASSPQNYDSQNVKAATESCQAGQCSTSGQPAQMRVTIRSVGPNNSTTSFVQGFIY
jgi:type IV pilus assembly protein PilX